jgi:putative restriction endonuclease
LPYALSIRINLDSPYADGLPVPTPGGGWLLSYHQEGADPAGRDRMFTNRGLMRCIADRVPVGVLRERAPAGHRSQYDVLGPALPVRWSDGYFFFESTNPRGAPVIDPISDVLAATARAELDQEEPTDRANLDGYDARLRVYRQIVARQGQPGFRSALLAAYQGRCAVTGCDAVPALEGAHLLAYRSPESNVVTNGLLLRADIHTLFDLGLWAPDPVTQNIIISKLLAETQYAALSTCRLAESAAAWQRPNQETLEITWQNFREAEDNR